MRNLIPTLILIAIVIAIDLYAFKSLKSIIHDWQNTLLRNSTIAAYWISSIVAYGLIIYAMIVFSRGSLDRTNYYFFFMGFALLLLIIIPKIVVSFFHLVDDVIQLFRWIASKLFINTSEPDSEIKMNTITRWNFISKLGWIVAAIPFFGILYGVVRGRFNFHIIEEDLTFSNLPESASGLKIVQISDIHIGSFFNNYDSLLPAIEIINDLEPDLILFTGDIVNNYADELNGWIQHLGQLKAKMGKYSILGNHDYGDYVRWPSEEAKKENLERLKSYHADIGFKLMLNENHKITLPDGQSFELIGVENWGAGRFSKYGDLGKAMENTDASKFQLLLSHDPSHWDAEVIKQTDIDLTLSGHTHGMQFGIEIPGFVKWSPAKYRYPRWAGLYQEKGQKLYVNRGLGYIGFPGRVGMPPEITLFRLNKA